MTSEGRFTSFIKGPGEDDTVPTVAQRVNVNIFQRFMLNGKVSAITGGLGAIGRAIAIGYAQAGSDVIILDYLDDDGKFCKELITTYGIRAKNYQVDVTQPQQVENVVKTIVDEFGTLDVFIANAGIPWYNGKVIEETASIEAWNRLFDVNLHGVFYCAKYVGRIFEKNNKGSFIVTASMSAHIVNVPQYKAAYNSSKAAVLHFAKSLAVEWVSFARVNSVSPGYTDGPLTADHVPIEDRAKFWAMTPLGREINPDELVGAYIYLGSDASTATVGADIVVDGGFTLV